MEVFQAVLNGILILFVIPESLLLGIKHVYFHADARFKNKLAQEGIVFKTSSPTMAICVIKCIQMEECVSLFYHPKDCVCHGYNNKLHYYSRIEVISGMLYFENTGLFGNLASEKPTSASSVFDRFFAPLAVDGVRNNIQDMGFCFHSAFSPEDIDNHPWMYVDLGKNYAIRSVSILARKECCSERMANMAITVGERSYSFDQTCVADTGPGFVNSMETFTCQSEVVGRYLKVQVFNPILNICELEVYGF